MEGGGYKVEGGGCKDDSSAKGGRAKLPPMYLSDCFLVLASFCTLGKLSQGGRAKLPPMYLSAWLFSLLLYLLTLVHFRRGKILVHLSRKRDGM